MKNYFLVAFSGGSIRGIFQMEIWDILTEKFPELQEQVQLYAGTSVGGISGGSLRIQAADLKRGKGEEKKPHFRIKSDVMGHH